MLAFFLMAGIGAAQQGNNDEAESALLRFDFTPLIGYRTGMSLTSEPKVQPLVAGSNPRLAFDASPSYGFAFGVRLNEQDLVEFRWARQDTYFHVEGTAQGSSRQPVVVDQFHGDFTHEYFVEDWPQRVRPFVVGSAGATRVSASASSSFTRFSFGLGGGFKVFATPHFGFKVQAQWLPIWVTPEVTAFVCGGGCVVRVGGTLSSQGEVTIGPVLRF